MGKRKDIEMNFLKKMPLPKVKATKLKAGMVLPVELENSSDGNIIKTIKDPSVKLELSGLKPHTIIISQKDLKAFLKSSKRYAEFELA